MKASRGLRLFDEVFIGRIDLVGDDELFDQWRQALGENDVGRFGALVFVVVQQLDDEGKFQERIFLGAGGFAGAAARADLLVQRDEVVVLPGGDVRVPLQEGVEIRREAEHDLIDLRAGVEFGIGGQVLEKDQGFVAKFLEDALARELALHEAAAGADRVRGEEIIRFLGEGLEDGEIHRGVEPDQFLDEGLGGGLEFALGFLQGLEDGGLQEIVVVLAVDEGGADIADVGVVFDEPGDDHADVVDGELADEGGDEVDELAVGFFAVLNGALEQLAQRLVIVLEGGVAGLELLDAQGQVRPGLLDFVHGRGLGVVLGLRHRTIFVVGRPAFNNYFGRGWANFVGKLLKSGLGLESKHGTRVF